MRCPRCGEILQPGSRTCSNCGRAILTPIAVRLFELRDSAGRSIPLRSGITRIGSDPASNEIVLGSPQVSSRHAAIEVSTQAVVVRDLGSDGGTSVNSQPIAKATVLQAGDTITIGDRLMSLEHRQPASSRVPQGIPTPVRHTGQSPRPEHGGANLSVVVATICLALLTAMLLAVGIAEGYHRETLPAPLAALLVALVVLPLAGVGLLAAGKRSGYLVCVIVALAGLAFVVISGPIFGGASQRRLLTDTYGSTGYWFVAIDAIAALIVSILLLSVSLAGWRMHDQHDEPARPPVAA